MKKSISNLVWGNTPIVDIVPLLSSAGIDAIEIAPTALWTDAPHINHQKIQDLRALLNDQGLVVSGIQSLLFNQPQFQVFDRETWNAMVEHLKAMISLGGYLGADVAVFGSPRNRIKASLSNSQAHEIAAEFLTFLLPTLEDNNMILTLEPNAPEYGADYLTHYADVVELADLINSPWIQPQIDTGCLHMVQDNLAIAARTRLPAHVHVSAPNLMMPPGEIDHLELVAVLESQNYAGWVVLEMLATETDVLSNAVTSAQWLSYTYP